MWEIIPYENFGLNLDRSHLIWQMIDYERVIHEFAEKLIQVYAKDLHVDRDGLTTMACCHKARVGRSRVYLAMWTGQSFCGAQAVHILNSKTFYFSSTLSQ